MRWSRRAAMKDGYSGTPSAEVAPVGPVGGRVIRRIRFAPMSGAVCRDGLHDYDEFEVGSGGP